MVTFFIVVGLAFAGSFLCSLCEAALYSVPDTRVSAMVHEGRPGAKRLRSLKSRVDRAIAAILTINTITHTAGASVGGAILADLYGNAAVGVFAAVFTVVLLLGTEIIPKSLGVAKADVLAPRLAWVIQTMIVVSFPLVLVCEWLSRAVIGKRHVVAPSEHEILTMTRLAASHGEIDTQTARVVRNALRLDEVTVRDLMTPRSVVFALPDRMPLRMIEQHSEHWTHSRLPLVSDRNPNEVVGIVHRRDVFDVLVRDDESTRTKTLADLKRPAMFIRDDVPADDALQKFLETQQHMFIVLDEYNSFVGLVTLEDVLEVLLGREIVGEHDSVTDMQELALRQAEPASPVIESGEEEARQESARAAAENGEEAAREEGSPLDEFFEDDEDDEGDSDARSRRGRGGESDEAEAPDRKG